MYDTIGTPDVSGNDASLHIVVCDIFCKKKKKRTCEECKS